MFYNLQKLYRSNKTNLVFFGLIGKVLQVEALLSLRISHELSLLAHAKSTPFSCAISIRVFFIQVKCNIKNVVTFCSFSIVYRLTFYCSEL